MGQVRDPNGSASAGPFAFLSPVDGASCALADAALADRVAAIAAVGAVADAISARAENDSLRAELAAKP